MSDLPADLPVEYEALATEGLAAVPPDKQDAARAALTAYIAGPMTERPTANHAGAIRQLLRRARGS